MTGDVNWWLDLIATMGTLLALVVAYFHLGRVKSQCTSIGMSERYMSDAVMISVLSMLYAFIIAIYDLGNSWLVGPTASAVILVDMIHTQTNHNR